MTRKIASLLIALLAVTSLLATSATAQDTSRLEKELPGVQAGYMRMYLPDPDATPVAEVVEDGSTTHTVMFMAYRFDSPESAASALETYATDGMKQFFEGDTERQDIPDLGDQAVQVSGTTEADGEDSHTVAVLAQENTDVYMVLAMGGDDTLAGQVVEVATTLIEQDEPETELKLDPNGGSTGSVYGIFAAAEDHELLDGLVPVMDMDLMQGREQATPAS